MNAKDSAGDHQPIGKNICRNFNGKRVSQEIERRKDRAKHRDQQDTFSRGYGRNQAGFSHLALFRPQLVDICSFFPESSLDLS